MSNLPSVEELPEAIIARFGTQKAKTGNWRTNEIEIDQDKCDFCMRCVVFCPDGAIKVSEGKLKMDLDYCKGCCICIEECPKNAIKEERKVELP
jgi:pyruvate ferredoxin oxidoreductase delta subunit